MSFAAWESPRRRTTATARSPFEAVDSPDKAGIFDRKLTVTEMRGHEMPCAPSASLPLPPPPTFL